MRFHRSTCLTLALVVAACGVEDGGDPEPVGTAATRPASPAPGLDERGRLTMDSLGILATYGLDEAAGPNAVLQRPLDAAFSGDHVLVLDASAPWVRRFERDGRFVAALVRQGDGPGEATQPYALAATDEGFLLSHRRGIERFSARGELVASMRGSSLRGASAIECDGALLAWIESSNTAFSIARALTRLAADGSISDTIAVHQPARMSTRDMWTWFADVRDGTLLFYSEEEGRARLERRSCAGAVLGELGLDSIGTGLVGRPTETGFVITIARAPHPSGLARIADRTLWATRRITAENDSITMIEAFDAAGGKRRLALEGWYQIFDADGEGRLLLGNSWTLGFNWMYGNSMGYVPAVHLIDGHALLAAIDAHAMP
jgi:hypothetical protein